MNDETIAKFKELSETMKNYNTQITYTYFPFDQYPCPSCGHCPTCGRGGYARPYPVGPIWTIQGTTTAKW